VSKNYVASPIHSNDGWWVTQCDTDGVGTHLFSLVSADDAPAQPIDTVVRVLLTALKLDGGLERALEVLKAEHARQENST
jgi:hypothetical protein